VVLICCRRRGAAGVLVDDHGRKRDGPAADPSGAREGTADEARAARG
jgi:hypothetical protein